MAHKIRGLVTGEIGTPWNVLMSHRIASNTSIKKKYLPFGYVNSVAWSDGTVTDGVMKPVPIWYIMTEDARILVDTGFDSVDRQLTIRRKLGHVICIRRKKEWEVRKVLSRVGVKPKDIDIVLLTHLHWDHLGNNELFKRATFIVQKDEIPLALSPPQYAVNYFKENSSHLVNILDRLEIIEGDKEIVNGVDVCKLGGHTPGSMGVLIKTDMGVVALMGDVIHDYLNLELSWPGPSGNIWNVEESVNAEKMAKKCADIVVPGHDWKFWEEFPGGKIG